MRKLFAVLTAAIVAAAALVTAAVLAPSAGAAEAPITGGSLDWGVKQSFRTYVVSPVAHGTITTDAGATVNPDGTFRFPATGGTLNSTSGAVAAEFGGTVRFTGHDGQLDMLLSDLRVEINGPTAVLWVDAVSLPFGEPTPTSYDDVVFATLDLSTVIPSGSATHVTFANVPAALHADGVAPFADFYTAGTVLDPLTFTLNHGNGATTSTTTGATSSTTSTVPTNTSTTTSGPGSTTSTTAPSTTSTTAPVGPQAPGSEVTGGGLDWGVKQSFRSYIGGPVAHGTIVTSGGATTNADGTIHFPAVATSSTYANGAVDARFSGAVRFTGHGGLLDMTITDVHVVSSGASGTLFADVTSLALEATAPAVFSDVALATLDLNGVDPTTAGTTITWPNVPSVLATAGAPAFSSFYTAGTAFDPATYALTFTTPPADPEPVGPTTTTVAPASTTATVDTSTVAPGGSVTVSASGFLAGEQVEVWLHSDPVFIAAVVADGSGNVTYTLIVPANTPAGEHRIELRGISSQVVRMSAPFTVAAEATTASRLPFTGAGLALAGVGLVVFLAGSAALGSGRLGARLRRAR